MDPAKIDALKNWLHPQTLESHRGFLGLNGYYCKFFNDYRNIVASLISLLENDTFTWKHDVECAFDKLKQVVYHTCSGYAWFFQALHY